MVQDYEEFYGDVHSEFIQFGEIVNFKVCRNSSPHLRGNVYVHYVSQESAMAAYNHMNGRFYAKKQISCEFVGVHKWKLAICGEFMRTYFKTCSRGTACSFLHCFENPHREYEWADTDRPAPRFWQRKMAKLFGYAHVSDEEADERSRTPRESTHDTDHRGRHRDDRELVYGNERKRDRRMRDSAREDDQKSGRGDRERKYYYEDEKKDRTRRGSSKYNDRHRERHSTDKSYDGQREKHERDSICDDDSASHLKEKSYDNRRREKSERDSVYDDDTARIAVHGGEPGCINDERWIAGDADPETDHMVYPRNRRRERHYRSTANDEHDDDDDAGHPGRHSPTSDRVGHHRSHRHRSRRSRSPSSHKARKSRSQDRSTSRRGRSQDGHYSSGEEQEDKHLKQARHRTERAPKESKRRRHGTGHDIHDNQLASDMPERREDEAVGKSNSSEDHPVSEHHQKASKMVDIRSTDVEDTVAGMMSDGNASGSNHVKLEIQSGVLDVGNQNQDTISSSSTGTILSLDLSTDHVQRSTSEWQSWRKTKKVKLGLKEKPMRVII